MLRDLQSRGWYFRSALVLGPASVRREASLGLSQQPQPDCHTLIHVLMRTDLDHDDAIVSDVGFVGLERHSPLIEKGSARNRAEP